MAEDRAEPEGDVAESGAASVVLGAAAGTLAGAFLGPVGAIVGAVAGGALAGAVTETDEKTGEPLGIKAAIEASARACNAAKEQLIAQMDQVQTPEGRTVLQMAINAVNQSVVELETAAESL